MSLKLLSSRRAFGIVAAFVFLAGVLAWRACMPVELEDVWWHLATGRWIFEHGRVPDVDIFAINPAHAVKGVSPSWLGSLILYMIQAFSGFQGLQIFRVIILVLPLLLWSLIVLRKKRPLFLTLFLTLVICEVFLLRAHLRPYIFNHAFFLLWLMGLWAIWRRGHWLVAMTLFPLMLLWRHIHLGFYVYGLSLLAVITVLSCMKLIRSRAGAPARRARQSLTAFGVLWMLAALAWVITPYGWEGITYPVRVLLDPSSAQLYAIRPIIAEMLPPREFLTDRNNWWMLTFLLVVFWSLASSRWRLTLMALFVVPLGMFLYCFRAIDFCVITSAALAIIAACGMDRSKIRLINRVCALLVIVMAARLIVLLAHPGVAIINGQPRPLSSLSTDPVCPDAALKFMRDHQMEGIVFNSSMYGGYLQWSAYPALRPVADNRFYNMPLRANYHLALNDPENYWDRFTGDYGITIALLNVMHPSSADLISFLAQRPDWTPVFVSGPHVVFVKEPCALAPEACQGIGRLRLSPIPEEDIRTLTGFQTARAVNILYHQDYLEAYALMLLKADAASLAAFNRAFEEGISVEQRQVIPSLIRYFQQKAGDDFSKNQTLTRKENSL